MKIILFCACAATAVSSVINAPAAKQDATHATEAIASNSNPPDDDGLRIVSREEWKARAPTLQEPLATPVPHVILHHTYTPGACSTLERCAQAMRSMQSYHMDDRGWNDIGYNFCVGGDGAVYEGRGWSTHGAHAGPTANGVSQGICLIGNWTAELPPRVQLDAAAALVRRGVALGYVRRHYTLLGHRQVRNTECPGDALFEEISTWKHFSEHPTSPDEPLSLASASASPAALAPAPQNTIDNDPVVLKL